MEVRKESSSCGKKGNAIVPAWVPLNLDMRNILGRRISAEGFYTERFLGSAHCTHCKHVLDAAAEWLGGISASR